MIITKEHKIHHNFETIALIKLNKSFLQNSANEAYLCASNTQYNSETI